METPGSIRGLRRGLWLLSGLLLIIQIQDAGGMFIERMLMIRIVKDKWMVEAIYYSPAHRKLRPAAYLEGA